MEGHVKEVEELFKWEQALGWRNYVKCENYASVEGHIRELEELFRQEQALGWMAELDEEEAKKTYGDRLFIAALGVVNEPGKIRVVHDGSNGVGVNHRIRPRDQTRSPGAGELRQLMREWAAEGRKSFALAGDVSKAHRGIKIRREDWGFQACRLRPGKVWVNKVGTYGMGSAAYYWARAAGALLVRLVHYLAGEMSIAKPCETSEANKTANARMKV